MITVTYSDGTTAFYTYGQGQQSNTTLETTLLSSSGDSLGTTVESVVTAAIDGQVGYRLLDCPTNETSLPTRSV